MVAPEALIAAADEPVLPEVFPFTGDGLSSFDLRFSGRGGKNAVALGEGDGVFELFVVDVLDDEFAVEVLLELVVDVFAPVVVRPPRPLLPPFLNLLCTELRVSVKYRQILLPWKNSNFLIIITHLVL